jgi:serine/threonine-protein kinase
VVSLRPFRVGDWRCEPTLNQIARDGEVVKLEPKAMEVLAYLAERAGEVVDKETVIRDVWQGAFVTNEVLTNAVWELRRALGDDAKSSAFIQTIPKRGYRLVAPVVIEDRESAGRRSPRRGRPVLAVASAGVVLLLGAVLLVSKRDAPPARTPIRFAVEIAEPLAPFFLPAVAISPDGARIAYASAAGIYIRPLDRMESRLVPGTKGGHGPFFSPDGESLGFFTGRTIQRVRLGGESPPVEVVASGSPRGAAWSDDGWIYLTLGSGEGLSRVRAAGGEVETLTELDEHAGEWTHRWPEVLPGGSAVLFTAARRDITRFDDAEIRILDLATGEEHLVVPKGSFARYAAGFLFYVRGDELLSVPFGSKTFEVEGEPRTVLKGLKTYPINGAAQFALSRDGSIAYVPAEPENHPRSRLVSVARDGSRSTLAEQPRLVYDPVLSRDGSRIALSMVTEGNSDLWLFDVQRETLTRLTTTPGEEQHPVLDPDGRTIAYDYSLSGPFRMFTRAVDGGGSEKPLSDGDLDERPESFAPDGKTLVFSQLHYETGSDLWLLALSDGAGRNPLLRSPFDERHARVSPDGRFLAYSSDESGRFEVYVTSFPEPGARIQVSVEGGSEPTWTRNGRELVFLGDSGIMAAAIEAASGLSASKPVMLFSWSAPSPYLEGTYRRHFDAAREGDHFLIVETDEDPAARRLHVVLNWIEEIETGTE